MIYGLGDLRAPPFGGYSNFCAGSFIGGAILLFAVSVTGVMTVIRSAGPPSSQALARRYSASTSAPLSPGMCGLTV